MRRAIARHFSCYLYRMVAATDMNLRVLFICGEVTLSHGPLQGDPAWPGGEGDMSISLGDAYFTFSGAERTT